MEQGSEENMESSWTLLSWLASGVMVFGGAVPYIPQYQDIQRTNNAEGFSTRVCLVLLVANILRIFFWIGKQFELPLLLQSVVMILTMLAMLHLCCSIQSSNRVSSKQHHITDFLTIAMHYTAERLQQLELKIIICVLLKKQSHLHLGCPGDLDLRYFWSWGSFEDYLIFCFAFTLLCAFITFLFLDWVLFVEALGSLAVMFEAMLGMPQLLQNYNNRSTRGMSVKMVLLWTAGDIFKTTYFVINESPTQFVVCGAVQILIDVAILLQVGYYGQDTRIKLG
uniref:Solute carrier family 66 member 2 n=1 Tax=Cyprinus carpio carpio TaxID=630221 RepID=A0A9J8CIS2_CYPCA